ncbi:OmpA family protein [Pseudomonas aeruginosa]|uniref:OmpA family protein n=1 Tax=Pseudomonas aeruginosa TaxID=287 RepID=UPI000FC3F9F0|nr:OmpA family protein [Pseudomonas aeruginosa]MBG7459499.1 OmpA family protein [Pseudomonas aeruginosa]RUB31053.1 OmpA family protein [Pseudomonas aeruginosa]WCV80489.1 OmpA family protein [Pseudomonas aeruginosa]HBO0857375.1 OmpA family protein [Pseudomonas aeruginosa]HBO5212018.1 OmpA family protein [Pseudomonas aeruginosa]
MLPQFHPSKLLVFALFGLLLGLAGCQSKPPQPQTGLSAEQIAVLQEQGFELRDEGWEFGMSSKVLFGNNLDRLNPDSRSTLAKIARALLAVDIDKVRLEGHTDNYGDEGYNQKLSERRAESVAAVFREAGMPVANIEVRGLGMSKPVADNKTRAGRSENRRVAIIVPAE